MRTIYKYKLPIDGNDHLLLIPAAIERKLKIVHVGGEGPVTNVIALIWAEVNTEAPPLNRILRVFGTGHEIPDGYEYVGTFIASPFVWHVYEKVSDARADVYTGG